MAMYIGPSKVFPPVSPYPIVLFHFIHNSAYYLELSYLFKCLLSVSPARM